MIAAQSVCEGTNTNVLHTCASREGPRPPSNAAMLSQCEAGAHAKGSQLCRFNAKSGLLSVSHHEKLVRSKIHQSTSFEHGIRKIMQ